MTAIPVLLLIASYISRGFALFVIKFLAFKALLIVLIVTVLPVVLNNVFYAIVEKGMSFATDQAASVVGSQPFVLEATGFFGYLLVSCRVPEVLSLTLSALAVSFTLRVLRVK